jgi:Terminase large subunit, T4likevirus-type, N-terminal
VPEVSTYHPFPRQCQFHSSPAKYRLFGGAAGPGKTVALLWEAIAQCLDVPASNSLLLRRTFPELDMNILSEWRATVPFREMGIKYNESAHLATFPNKSTLRFGYCQSENDVFQYQGAEFLFIGVDELTMFTLKQWLFLATRNRCRVPGSFPCMAGATNPGNIGHAWVKSLWIDKKPAPGMREQDYKPEDYDFIPARLEDNPIYAQDADYRAKLEASPMRDALLRGIWSDPPDKYFTIFDYETHTRAPEDIKLPAWTRYWMSDDWGDYHPNVMYLHAMDHTGQVVTLAEHWGRHMSEPDIAREAARLAGPRPIEAFIFSWDAFGRLSKHTRQPITQQVARDLPPNIPPPFPADATPGSRISGWRFMRNMLEQGRWIISRECVRLIECLPQLMRDMDKNPEDVLKVDWTETTLGDDPADAARYGLQYVSGFVPQVPKDPAPVESGAYEAFRLKERIEGMDKREDPSVAVTISNVPRRRRGILTR